MALRLFWCLLGARGMGIIALTTASGMGIIVLTMQDRSTRAPTISPRDLAWLAGFLEGEGCFSSQRYYQNRTCWYDLPSIQVNMTDRDVVARAGRLLGGRQVSVRVNCKTKHKDQYVWRVNGKRAVHVMRKLLPHMGKRRAKRISALIRSYEASISPQGSRGYRRYSSPLDSKRPSPKSGAVERANWLQQAKAKSRMTP